ncbi:DMT family transporter [Paroceanicella profunda]|uniref:DMT family transporter n=1 Tax=Paroceanicella profunda TaxID=2579971 RepID=A0A5B8FUY4_9RHOB|nr:DMT family transporter [Paroceanicella profunda]QDL91124.1 DMT family transporter [Paroceanicella profunda]
MAEQNTLRGILYMVLATIVFSAQDGLSKHLAEAANPMFVIMVRYWAFMIFVTVISARSPGGLSAAVHTKQPLLQAARGVLLVLEILVTVWAFTLLGLAATHAIFACYPLLVVAFSGPVLGEKVGWRRWSAVGVGFLGILVILRPGLSVIDPNALVALVAAGMFAAYGLMTRLASRKDPATTSFFWTGIAGGVTACAIGPFYWTGFSASDWGLMGILCITGAGGHYLLIKALETAEAATVQPFAYLQLVFASSIGIFFFGEHVDAWTVTGAAVIVGAGLYTFWRESVRKRRA